MSRLLLALLAVLALTGCGKRMTAPSDILSDVDELHAAEDAYWERNPNGSELELWAGQRQVGGLPQHYRAMVGELKGVGR